jgi:nucleotide-binding universal stress UspA family protein
MKHILAAIDGSKPSYRALEHAAKLAKVLGAELSLLVVRQFVVGRRDVLEVWSNEEVKAILAHAKEVVAAEGGPEPAIIEESSRDVAFTIVDVALKRGVDLVVMGASGGGSIKSFILGSVSKDVLRKSALPVTIVH